MGSNNQEQLQLQKQPQSPGTAYSQEVAVVQVRRRLVDTALVVDVVDVVEIAAAAAASER